MIDHELINWLKECKKNSEVINIEAILKALENSNKVPNVSIEKNNVKIQPLLVTTGDGAFYQTKIITCSPLMYITRTLESGIKKYPEHIIWQEPITSSFLFKKLANYIECHNGFEVLNLDSILEIYDVMKENESL